MTSPKLAVVPFYKRPAHLSAWLVFAAWRGLPASLTPPAAE
jgi:hypothetical protein